MGKRWQEISSYHHNKKRNTAFSAPRNCFSWFVQFLAQFFLSIRVICFPEGPHARGAQRKREHPDQADTTAPDEAHVQQRKVRRGFSGGFFPQELRVVQMLIFFIGQGTGKSWARNWGGIPHHKHENLPSECLSFLPRDGINYRARRWFLFFFFNVCRNFVLKHHVFLVRNWEKIRQKQEEVKQVSDNIHTASLYSRWNGICRDDGNIKSGKASTESSGCCSSPLRAQMLCPRREFLLLHRIHSAL